MPYTWGTTGIIYNTKMVKEKVDSWSILFDGRCKGEILMIDNPRDAFAVALSYLGYSINTTDKKELMEAYDLLVKQKDILQAYVMDQIFDKLEGGEAAMGVYYAGDFLSMKEQQSGLGFRHPQGRRQLLRGRHVRAQGRAEQDGSGGVDQLHVLL